MKVFAKVCITSIILFSFCLFEACRDKVNPELATVTTLDIINITDQSAWVDGRVVNNGGADVSQRGICWKSSTGPTISDDKTTAGVGTGSFTVSIVNLQPSTTYFARAYAINSVGVAYGAELSFTTAPPPSTLATLTTSAASDLTHNSATVGGSISSDGGASITSRGICYRTTTGPTISDPKTSNDSGTGSFSGSLTSLTPSTTYFARAYAMSSAGTAYGNEISFTTEPPPAVLATLTTAAASDLTHNSATVGGSISDDGGATVTVRGICYGTTTGPTIADPKTSNGSGTGSFSGSLISLTPSTTYFARAYATNSAGTAYGNEISFATNANSTVNLDVVKDASIFNNAAGNAVNGDYGSGGSQVLQVGFSSSATMYARTLLQFDVSSIPNNAVIESVNLQMTDAVSGGSVPVISIYKVTQGWSEGATTDACVTTTGCSILGSVISPGGNDVTWNVVDFSTSVAWTTVGGTFNVAASATSGDAGANLNLFTSAGLVADVQAWVSGSSNNYGWIMKISEPTTGSGKIKRYASRNSTSTKPKVVIVYH